MFLLLPECGRRMAEAFVVRLITEQPELIAGRNARIVAFPEDGLTSGALLERLADDAALPASSTAAGNGSPPADREAGARAATRRLVTRLRAIRNGRATLEPDAPAAPADAAEQETLETAREGD